MKKIISSKILLFTLLTTLSACLSSSKMKNRHYQQWSEISSNSEDDKNKEKTIVFIDPNISLESEILNETISIHSIVPSENKTIIQ
jgi:hypothetical protein